jgi:hypothetical protein
MRGVTVEVGVGQVGDEAKLGDRSGYRVPIDCGKL